MLPVSAKSVALYATRVPVRFSDRAALEEILAAAQPNEFGVRSIMHALVQSKLFLEK